jgi:uncharacterized protein (UPF0332 family)
MPFADDLLEQAYHLAHREPTNPTQASLRRAVSTAYYALFHLLIDEAVGNWNIARQRGTLARTFDHGRMRSICNDTVKQFYSDGKPQHGLHLKRVAESFIRLQVERHRADYDISFEWETTDVVRFLELATAAFADWRAIRDQEAAQDYLLSLFLPRLPRQ